MINALSGLASAFTILFLFWTITHLARHIIGGNESMEKGNFIAIIGTGVVALWPILSLILFGFQQLKVSLRIVILVYGSCFLGHS
jgi:hypothetical protein